MIKQAVIFCGGFGTRLQKITNKIPKPMVDVAGKPFLEHLIVQLKKNGIKKIIILTIMPTGMCEDPLSAANHSFF